MVTTNVQNSQFISVILELLINQLVKLAFYDQSDFLIQY